VQDRSWVAVNAALVKHYRTVVGDAQNVPAAA